ncbi:hypothetical protein [Roseovarius sp. M141]|uniref:hypothetical protein n=1 Tax=Roseovarius sp. M141 TaxID=2583806 RepID=UPI0020CEC737|nr:hypothetical protein [Roseovarius sp. M141]MCQ0094193.1 hypothetical protein [Roseovarius sp. M141]
MQAKTSFTRSDFIIEDLVISIGGGSRGNTWLPGPDDETPPTPISPVASVLVNMGTIETVRATIQQALASGQGLKSIGRAFVKGAPDANSAIQTAIFEIGAAVVASAAYASAGKGSVGYPDPNCGGTSLETIPTPITPVVNIGRDVHQVTELPRLRQQLTETMKFVDSAVRARSPNRDEVGIVRENLEKALKSLG